MLEDDLIISPYFLQFMNDGLTFYQKEEKVMHISGYTFPIAENNLPETFFFRVPMCWGWATWSNKWRYFDRNLENIEKIFTRKMKYQFNLEGAYKYSWGQIEENRTGEINTWFIFWYASVFLKGGLCLFPSISMVQNIGHDGSGIHCWKSNYFQVSIAEQPVKTFETNIRENINFLKGVKNFYKDMKPHILIRIVNKLLRLLLK